MSVDLAKLALSVDANGFVKADKTMTAFNKTASNTEKQADKITKSTDRMSQQMAKAEKNASHMSKALGMISAAAAALLAAEISKYADKWSDLTSRVQLAVGAQQKASDVMERLSNIARMTYSSVEVTTESFVRNARTLSALGKTTEQQLNYTEALNNALVVSGAKGMVFESAQNAMNKAMAEGVLRGDELNNILNNGGRVAELLAQSLNVSITELRRVAKEGKITGDVIFNSLIKNQRTLAQEAESMPATVADGFQLIKNSILEAVGVYDQAAGLSANLAENIVGISDAIRGVDWGAFAENIHLVEDAATLLAIVFGSKLVASLALKTQATIADLAATNAQIKAEQLAALGAQRRAVAEQNATMSALKKAQAESAAAAATVNAARVNAGLSASTVALTKAQQQQAVAQANLNGAVAAYAAAASAAGMANTRLATSTAAASMAGAAMRGLGGAMALLGGPLGVAMIAGAAIYYFATRASEAEKILQGLNPEVDGLAERFGMLGDAQKQLARKELANQLDDQREKVAGLTAQLNSLNDAVKRDPNGFFTNYQRDKIIEVSAAIEGAKKELSNLQGQFDSVKVPDAEIQKIIDKMTGLNEVMGYFITGNSVATFSMIPPTASAEVDKVSEAYAKLSYEIQKQIDLNGDSSKSASLAYDIQKGAIKDMTQAEALRLVGLHKTKEAMDLQKEAADEAKKSAEKFLAIIEEMEMDELFGDSDGIDPFAGLDDPAIQKAIKAQREEFDELINSVDEFGGAWTRTGSIVADSLGSIIDVMDDYSRQIDAIIKKEDELRLAKAATYDKGELKQIQDAENKLAKQRTAANIGSFRAIAGAASQMFSEQSKGRKALHNIEMAFSAIEMAMTIQRSFLIAKEAVLNQAKGDPYSAWARMAAMAAAVAALGYAVGGGGGGTGQTAEQIQAAQGTGSVLGSDSKSESLEKSFDNFSDIAVDQLTELRAIRDSLAVFKGGIAQLSMSLSTTMLADQKRFAFQNQSFGHAMNVGLEIGGSKLEHMQMRSALMPLQGEIKAVLGFMADTVTEGVKSLGLEFENSIWDYWINIGKVSFKDMSAEEISQELSAILSKEADLLTAYLIPQLKEYQQMGEGLFETLTRVAKEQAVFDDAIKNMGLSLGSMSNLMRIDVAQSIITLMGGLEEFSEKTGEYFENFYTEQERMEILGGSLGEAFGAINQSLPKSKEEFRGLVEALDLTTEADQKLFASLMELNPALAQYIESTEKAAQASIDASRSASQAALSALEKSITAERALSKARLDSAVATVAAAQAERDFASKAYDQAANVLTGSFQREIDRIQIDRDAKIAALEYMRNESARAREAAINSEIEKYTEIAKKSQQYANSLRSVSQSLNSAIVSMNIDNGVASRRAAQSAIDSALIKARSGDFSGALNLGDLSALQNTEGMFTTRADRDFDIAVTQGKLVELAKLTEAQASIEDRAYQAAIDTVERLDRQLESTESIDESVKAILALGLTEEELAAQIANDDAQISGMQDQLDAMLGVDKSIVSIGDAIKQFMEAKEQLAVMDAQLETAKTALAVAQSMYDAEIMAYDQIISQQTAIYNEAMGINASVKSVDAAILDLSNSLVNYAEISKKQQEELASKSNQQLLAGAEKSANEKLLSDEIVKLRAENKRLQEDMAASLKKIEENSTRTINRELLA